MGKLYNLLRYREFSYINDERLLIWSISLFMILESGIGSEIIIVIIDTRKRNLIINICLEDRENISLDARDVT